MPFDPLGDPNAYRVSGVDPNDPAFRSASRTVRMKFYNQVGTYAASLKDRDLANGIGADGRKLRPISEATRKRRLLWDYSPMGQADPNAPPLTPVYSLSRTRSLLRWKAYDGYVVFFWAYDQHSERPWGEILAFHRNGGPHLPVRDVIGLSPASTVAVKRLALAFWKDKAGTDIKAEKDASERHIGPSGIIMPKSPVIADYRTGYRQLREGRFVPLAATRHVDFLAGVGIKER